MTKSRQPMNAITRPIREEVGTPITSCGWVSAPLLPKELWKHSPAKGESNRKQAAATILYIGSAADD